MKTKHDHARDRIDPNLGREHKSPADCAMTASAMRVVLVMRTLESVNIKRARTRCQSHIMYTHGLSAYLATMIAHHPRGR